MLKVLAVVRSIMLGVVLFFMARAYPRAVDPSLVCDEQRRYFFASAQGMVAACWIAVGWIALEAGITWWRALRRSRKLPTPATPATPIP